MLLKLKTIFILVFTLNLGQLQAAPSCTALKNEYQKIGQDYLQMTNGGKSLQELQREHDLMMAKYVALCGIRSQIQEIAQMAAQLAEKEKIGQEGLQSFLNKSVPVLVFQQSFDAKSFSVWTATGPEAIAFKNSFSGEQKSIDEFKKTMRDFCRVSGNQNDLCAADRLIQNDNQQGWSNLFQQFKNFSQAIPEGALASTVEDVRNTFYKKIATGFGLSREKIYSGSFYDLVKYQLEGNVEKNAEKIKTELKKLAYDYNVQARAIDESNTQPMAAKFYADFKSEAESLANAVEATKKQAGRDSIEKFQNKLSTSIDQSLQLLNVNEVKLKDGSEEKNLSVQLTEMKKSITENTQKHLNACLQNEAESVENCLVDKFGIREKLGLGDKSLNEEIASMASELKAKKAAIEKVIDLPANQSNVALYNFAQYQLIQNCQNEFSPSTIDIEYSCKISGLSGKEKFGLFYNESKKIYEHVASVEQNQDYQNFLGNKKLESACAQRKQGDLSNLCSLLVDEDSGSVKKAKPLPPAQPDDPAGLAASSVGESVTGSVKPTPVVIQTHQQGGRAVSAVAKNGNGAAAFAEGFRSVAEGVVPGTLETFRVNQTTVGLEYQKKYYDKMYEYNKNFPQKKVIYYYYPYNVNPWGVQSYNVNQSSSFNVGNSSLYSTGATGSLNVQFPDNSYFNDSSSFKF